MVIIEPDWVQPQGVEHHSKALDSLQDKARAVGEGSQGAMDFADALLHLLDTSLEVSSPHGIPTWTRVFLQPPDRILYWICSAYSFPTVTLFVDSIFLQPSECKT